MTFEGYTSNKLGQYAFTQGYIKGVLASKRTDLEKLELITAEMNHLEERLLEIKETEKNL